VDDSVRLPTRSLARALDQREQTLVRVRVAEEIDRFAGEDLVRGLLAVRLGNVVAKTREDEAVDRPSLSRVAASAGQLAGDVAA
jgi:putative heme degradation protein